MTATETTIDHGQANAAAWWDTIKDLVQRLKTAEEQAIDGPDETGAPRTEIEEGPLSVMVRDGWREPGASEHFLTEGGPEEFVILLSTGGPALRIWGTLDHNNQPDECELQYQDWGTPWTRWVPKPYDETFRDTLQAYASCFYFGD